LRDWNTIVLMERSIGACVVQNTASASLGLKNLSDQEAIAALNACMGSAAFTR
jgi:hypothetical protein